MRIPLARSLAVVATFSFVFAPLAAGDDWTQFRGPRGDGHTAATGLPLHWNAEENVAWRQLIPGEGWSSPVVAAGRIFLTYATDDAVEEGGASLRAISIASQSGEVIWDREVFRQDPATADNIHKKNSHASPTVLIEGQQLFAHFGPQGTACLRLDGAIVWKNRELVFNPVHGNGGSPIFVDGTLIFTCDGQADPCVAALDASNGSLLWRFERPGDPTKKFSFCTPTAVTVNGTTQVVVPGSDSVSGLDPVDGREIWRVRYDGYSVVPRPVYGQGLVYICTGYNKPSLLAIRVNGRGDVTDSHVAWSLDRSVPNTPSLLLQGENLYMVSDGGVISCLNAQTGELVWRDRLDGNFSASPLLAEGRIYIQNEEGTCYVVRAGDEFELLAENRLGERSLASLAPVKGALYLRTDKHLYKLAESR